MIDNELFESIIEVLKIFAILFALFHFLVGLILFRDMIRMNRIIKTSNRGCFTFISFFYIFVLLCTLVLFILV